MRPLLILSATCLVACGSSQQRSTASDAAPAPDTGGAAGSTSASASSGGSAQGGAATGGASGHPSGTGGILGTGGTKGTAGTSGSGGEGGFTLPACASGQPSLPATAPVLKPGVWKDISPPGIGFSATAVQRMFTQGMAIDPCNPARLYLTVAGFDTSTFATLVGGLYRSTDAGSSWNKLGAFDQPLQIRVDPADPLHLYVGDGVRGGTMGFWVSKDGGKTWAIPQGFLDVAKKQLGGDMDVYRIEPDPTDFNHVLVTFHWYWDGCAAGCNAGIIESFDGGDSWTVHAPRPEWAGGGGYNVFFLYAPKLGIGNNRTWLYGTQGGKGYWRTSDSGGNWTKVSDAGIAHGGGQIYYTAAGVLYASSEQQVLRSTDNGQTFAKVGTVTWETSVYGDGHRLYTEATAGDHFVTSLESDGLTWTDYQGGAQKFVQGPFEMAFDVSHAILYSASWGAGMLALAVAP